MNTACAKCREFADGAQRETEIVRMKGKLYLCATPIGNLGDISRRLIETLGMVDLIAAEDTRRTARLLNHIGVSKPQTSYFEHNRRAKGEAIIAELLSGKNVALVSDAGTPAISDPGEDLVSQCAEAGIEVVAVPGPVAAVCALTVSGLPTGRFAFEGFLSVNKRSRAAHLEKVKSDDRTLIFYEAPHKLLNTLRDMLSVFGDRKIALCREITKLHEETIRCTLSEAITHFENTPPRGEFTLVVEGAAAAEPQNEWEGMTAKGHVSYYLSLGMDEKDAIRRAAKDRGVPKREIYALVKTKNADERE